MKKIVYLLSLCLRLLCSFLGWLIIVPLTFLVPQRKDWVGVFGREDGRFLDNAKYFFLQAKENHPDFRVVFITERCDVADSIAYFGEEVYQYPNIKSVWFLLRCGSFMVDEVSWHKKLRFYFLFRSDIIQIWHGVPFKWIELELWKNQLGSLAWASTGLALKARVLLYKFTGRWMRYAAVVTTSEFYKVNSFTPSFRSKCFPVVGYPRNDFAQSLSGRNMELAWSNTDVDIRSRLADWERLGIRLVLIAPTFRDSGSVPMQLDADSLHFLDEIAEEHNIKFIFKFHPYEKALDHVSGNHFHICDRESDIYPILPYLSALVTDYSSISMDFLLIDKPLIFLIPKDDRYMDEDRKLQFDPRAMMPGPVVTGWRELIRALLKEWGNDSYKEQRLKLRLQTFDGLNQSDAVPKLLALIREQDWFC